MDTVEDILTLDGGYSSDTPNKNPTNGEDYDILSSLEWDIIRRIQQAKQVILRQRAANDATVTDIVKSVIGKD